MEAPLIVIVDDIPRNIQLLGQLLKSKGYRVLALTDSKKAVNAIEKNQPVLVLLDVMMPDIDGYEVCKILKSKPQTADIPIIFLTAKTETEDIVKGFEMGAVDYVTKPFNKDELFMRVQTQVALKDAITKAEKANAAKSDFLANISHDIRSPMNGIMNVMELLLKSKLDNEQSKYVKMAKLAGTSLLCLINDILDLSKIEAGQLSLDYINFDLRELLENISDIYAIEANKKGLEYACIIPWDMPTKLYGDPNRLRQIIINLVNNAIKFTHEGEVVITVKQQSGKMFHFDVQDTGKGISADRIHQLFKPYSQLESSTARKYGGTGLGLSISKQLVELMNGKISAQSEKHKGSTFSFTAELLQQEGVPVNPVIKDLPKSVNVLIIHRHDKTRQAFINLLKSFSCSCHEANDAMSTLAVLGNLNLSQINCQIVFIDKETYDTDIHLIRDSFKDNPALYDARWVMLKKIGTTIDCDFDETLILPAHFESVIDCFKNAFKINIMDDQKLTVTCSSGDNILVIDDELINRMIAENLLKKIGCTPDLAENCQEALTKLAQNDYKLVLTDLYMPDMTAIQLTETIRNPESDVKNHDVKIVVVSASDIKSDKEDCMAVGVNGCLTKPYSIEQLQHILDEI